LQVILEKLLEQERGKISKMVFDAEANTDFDETLAKNFSEDEDSDDDEKREN